MPPFPKTWSHVPSKQFSQFSGKSPTSFEKIVEKNRQHLICDNKKSYINFLSKMTPRTLYSNLTTAN